MNGSNHYEEYDYYLEDAEHWENAHVNIPSDLQIILLPLLKQLILVYRIIIYKILDSLAWSKDACSLFHDALSLTKLEQIDNFFKIITSFNTLLIKIFLSIYTKLTVTVISEVHTISLEQIHKLIDIVKYLNKDEINMMINIIVNLSLSELLAILDVCNEPMAKHCRLCRTKKLYNLEFRMLQDDPPKNMVQQ
jgi:hypothetical protein